MRKASRAIACWVAGAIAALCAVPASATSSADAETFLLSRRVDPNGLTFLRKTRQRSPTGFLYPYPFQPFDGITLGDDWRLRGFAEVGWAESWGGSNEAYFEKYSDYKDGAIDAGRLEAHHAGSGAYAELGASALGRDDASAFLDAGQRGWLRVRAYYDELPHRYANDARVLFDGVGSENLMLPPGLVAGGNPDAAIDEAIAVRANSRLAVQREKTGVELQFDANPNLALRAGYRNTERNGERPFGGAIRFAFQSPVIGSVVETVEPVNSRTHDFHADFSVTDPLIQMEFGYEGSVFDNRVQSLTWDNPFPNTNVPQGRFALAPDNLQHRLHGTLNFPPLPARGRWTHTVSWISARQNEHLLAPTINAAFPDWIDPVTSLARDSADARVDTTIVTSTLRLSPLRRLSTGAKLRYQRRDNRTNYFALNPAIADFGYVIEDGSFGVQDRYGSVPFDSERLGLEGSATLQVLSKTRLSLEYDYEEVTREERARRRTRDHRGRVSLSTRRIPYTTVRLAYEVADRSGSTFQRDRDALFYSAGPPDFAPPAIGTPQRSLSSFEQYDLADRLAQGADARVNFQLGDMTDLAFAGGVRDEDYDPRDGLRRGQAANANAELTFQLGPRFDARAFGGAEWRERELDTIDSLTFVGTDFSPGGPVFPFDHSWEIHAKERTFSAGAGTSARPWKPLELRADYQLLISRERMSYDYAGIGALAPGVTPEDAGSQFPNLRNADHILDFSARIELSEWLAVRALYRFQHSTIANFHQTGLVPRIGRALYLAHVDGDFTAHVLGGSVQVRF